jgi:ABC-type Fe3+-hydroxamate transport system substrate-binding protein
MTIGSDTFIHEMLSRCGLHNVFENESRYPAITTQELIARNTALVLLSSEPYPFKQKHVEELQKELPHATILLVDGEMFSWYGSRLQYVVGYFLKLLESIQLLVQEQKS